MRFGIPALAACVLGAIGGGGSAKAQSFDCEEAGTRVERTICADRTLGELDSDLSEIYTDLLDLAADGPGLVAAQRAWLRRRDACPDAACVTAAYRARLEEIALTPRAGWATWRDAELGISFEHLANREVRPCPEGYERCVALYGRHQGRPDHLLMAFEVFEGGLEQVSREHAGFEQRDGGWFTTYGRFEPQPVKAFNGPGWTGLEAVITCGISDENGFHAGAGDCYWGVMSDGRRATMATTEGIAGLDDDTRRSVTSLRFLP